MPKPAFVSLDSHFGPHAGTTCAAGMVAISRSTSRPVGGAVRASQAASLFPLQGYLSTMRGQAPLTLPKWRVNCGNAGELGSGQTGLPTASR